MKRTLVPVLAIAATAAVIFLGQAAAGKGTPTKADIGAAAPSFALEDVYGKTFTLGDFKEHVVVLEWINQHCPVSHGKHKDGTMQNTYKKYADKGVIWLAIDSTYGAKPEANRVYAAQMGIAYPILHDPDGKVGHMYGAKTTPHMFVIDKKGVLVYDGAIDDQGKANYVAAALDAVLAGKPVENAKTKPYGCGVKYKQ
jgi:peroxiredoxin